MRIISGSFRGKKIHEPKDIKTRPLKDLTKESIFNIINHSNKFNINPRQQKTKTTLKKLLKNSDTKYLFNTKLFIFTFLNFQNKIF